MAYTSIAVEGGLFPADLLDSIATGNAPGQRDQDFGLDSTARLSDEIQLAFSEVRKHWDSFQARLARGTTSTTTLTREHWIIPLFETLGVELSFQRAAQQVGSEAFLISHLAGTDPDAAPVHVIALGQSLDRRSDGGRRSPHAIVQDYLNRSDAVWGIVTNGDHLRLLRDAQALARPAYVEFDLRAMVEGNLYSEFVLFFRLLHVTRWVIRPIDATSWLERYYQDGIDVGGRVREHLRDGVEEAIKRLGTAFLAHPDSSALREAVERGELDAGAYYRELLRLVYRFLFLFVVEERKLLFPLDNHGDAEEWLARQEIYRRYYSMANLRGRCERLIEVDGYSDLWDGLKQTFSVFRDQHRAEVLGLAALNGELFGPDACTHIERASCFNVDLLAAMFHISTFRDRTGRRRVNYAALDVEELGSVYESLLEFHPKIETGPTPRFDLIRGSERKQTGSYYTPPSLVAELIKSALVPVVQDRLAAAPTWQAKEEGLLRLKVVDPASGSGHFLLAAARTIARELARVRNEGNEPSPEGYRRAVRDVVRSCIYAVDRNPLAVDLCKVALWIEGYNAGMPLSFLDHHIKCGDSLVGVFDIDVLDLDEPDGGIPDEAYVPVVGDDKKVAAELKRRNKAERAKLVKITGQGWQSGFQQPLLGTTRLGLDEIARSLDELNVIDDRTPKGVQAKEQAYRRLRNPGTEWWRDRTLADLWTAAFFLPMGAGNEVPTTGTLRATALHEGVRPLLLGRVGDLADEFPFFHWPLEFPDVFIENGGFDVVLGNPPWERIKLQEKEFFAVRDPEIANAQNKAARKRLIDRLSVTNAALVAEFETAKHTAEATSRFIRGSGRFPLCGHGDVNLYSVFAETSRRLLSPHGRSGLVLQTGIVTDDTNKAFFEDLIQSGSLASVLGFENEEFIFPAVTNKQKFCALTVTGQDDRVQHPDFAFYCRNFEQVREPTKHFSLTAKDIGSVNPNTRTCPTFHNRRDAHLSMTIYSQVPILWREQPDTNHWELSFLRMFDMANNSSLFRSRQQLEQQGWKLKGNIFRKGQDTYMPLYEAKMVWQYDHRFASYLGKGNGDGRPRRKYLGWYGVQPSDPHELPLPLSWVPRDAVRDRLSGRWEREWLLGWRDVTGSGLERTLVACIIPRTAVGNKFLLALPHQRTELVACLLASLDSFVVDYCARQKVSGAGLPYFTMRQLPILPPSRYDREPPWSPGELLSHWIAERVLALVYSAWDMRPFALDLGFDGPPFPWDEEQRFLLRCELDAAFFHLYGIHREDVEYIMETFPIVKRKDEAKHGEYRTKTVILEFYDAMNESIRTGVPYGEHAPGKVRPITASATP